MSVVDELWAKYDEDGNDTLEKEECLKFMKDVCGEMNQDVSEAHLNQFEEEWK